MTDPARLWQQLQQAQLVSSDQPAAQNNQQPAFFLRILLGASGWLSALFFCGFISAFFIGFLSSGIGLGIIGVILCLLSIGLSRVKALPILIQQFIFACSLAGQAQIMFAVLQISDSPQLSAAILLILEILLFFLIHIRSQRTVTMVIACAAVLWLLGAQKWIYALPALSAAAAGLWLYRLRLYQQADYLLPATAGLTLALWLVIFAALLINSTELAWWNINNTAWHSQLWIAAALSSAVCLLLAWQLIHKSMQHTHLRYLAVLISLGVALVNLKMPGLAPLCLLLCIGVAQAHNRLIWLNLGCLAGYLLLYYYNLNDTLLYKSILLCVSGAVLLALYGLLSRYTRQTTVEVNTDA